jgi:uncharacterized protein YkwD
VKRLVQVALAVLAAAVLAAAAAGTSARAADAGTGQLELAILSGINQVRAQHGLRPLCLSSQLDASAVEHSWSMASLGYFSHSSSDGTSFGVRVSQYYGRRGYSVWRVGETLFWATPSATPRQLVRAWLDSPEHRAVMLSPLFHQVGIGVVRVPRAPGMFSGRPVTIVTADYGVRR